MQSDPKKLFLEISSYKIYRKLFKLFGVRKADDIYKSRTSRQGLKPLAMSRGLSIPSEFCKSGSASTDTLTKGIQIKKQIIKLLFVSL